MWSIFLLVQHSRQVKRILRSDQVGAASRLSYLSLYYVSVACLTGSGTVISIHEERLQISEPGRKENESV